MIDKMTKALPRWKPRTFFEQPDPCEDCEQLAAELKQLREFVGAMKWMAASEEAPHDGEFLCQVTERQECGNTWTFMAIRPNRMNRWVLSGDEVLVAWMPLPEPYTEAK